MHLVFLPAYSPDYNPIELAFSAIKAHVHRSGTLRREDIRPGDGDTWVYLHLLDVAFSITADDAKGFFHKCGYL